MKILDSPNAVAALCHHRIALFSGAFDPVHHGHWDSVAKGLEAVDAVIVLPCPTHPRKTLEDLAHRTRMIRESFPAEFEERVFLGIDGVGFTFLETGYCRILPQLNHLMKRNGQNLVILRGQDAFHEPYPRELAVMEHIVIARDDCGVCPDSFVEGPFRVLKGSWGHLSSTNLKAAIYPGAEGLHPRVVEYILSKGLYGTKEAAFA